MTVAEKIEIVHKVVIEHEFQKDVAREYRVKNGVINQIVRKARKRPQLLDELVADRDRK